MPRLNVMDLRAGWGRGSITSISRFIRCVVVRSLLRNKNGEARLAFDLESDVCLALSLLKNHQVAFPFAKNLTGFDVVKAFMDRPIRWKHKATRCAPPSWLPLLATMREIARQTID